MKQIGAHVPDKLHRRFKLACVQAGKDMTEIMRELILSWVEGQERKLLQGLEQKND